MTVSTGETLQYNDPSTPRKPPRASRHRPKKSANDVRVDPASTEVISSLLASLSSVSVASDDDSPLVPRTHPRTPSPSSIIPSARTSARHSARPSASFPRPARPRDARDPSIDFPEVVHPPPPAVSIELPPDGDVAQPPTIRTSRRPSGYSKVTAPKQPRRPPSTSSLESQCAAQDLLSVPPSASRPISQIAPLPRTTSRNKIPSTRASSDEGRRAIALGQRDSLIVHRSKEAKGKGRAKHDSINSTVLQDVGIPRSSSRFHVLSPRSARTHLSKQSSRAPSIHEDVEPFPEEVEPVQPLEPQSATDEFVVVHSKTTDKRQDLRHGRKIIPSRSSSLRHTSDSPPSSRFLSRRSSRQSYHKSPETVPEEDVHLRVDGTEIEQTHIPMLNELDEDHDTVKRIRELQLAKEARQRMQAVVDLPVAANAGTRYPLPPVSEATIIPNGDVTQGGTQEHEAIVTAEGLDRYSEANGSIGKPSVVASHSPEFKKLDTPKVQRFALSPKSPRNEVVNTESTALDSPIPDAPSKPILPSSPFRRKSKRWSGAGISPTFHIRSNSQKDAVGVPDSVAEKVTRSSIDSVNDSVREFLQSPRLSQKIVAANETRQIAFSEVGDAKGHVIICCPGMGLTRYVMAFYDELATSLKLRLITPDRPGVGDSGAYGESKAPLHWPDDVRAICAHLKIQRFSLLAHSAGAIYALATALSMPSRVRGHIHLLAPWIPPSQLSSQRRSTSIHPNGVDSPKRSPSTPQPTVPRSQRFLRLIPTPFFKLTNAGGFLAGARPSNSSDPMSPPSSSSSPWSRKSASADSAVSSRRPSLTSRVPRPSFLKTHEQMPAPLSPPQAPTPHLENTLSLPDLQSMEAAVLRAGASRSASRPATPANIMTRPTTARLTDPSPRQRAYDAVLTPLIWELATRNANPHIDLVVCLERSRPIGFHYADVPRAVVIRHGSRDARVPVENAVWLGGVMRGAEVRVLDGEGHGLMGRAGVMGDVLGEVAAECVR